MKAYPKPGGKERSLVALVVLLVGLNRDSSSLIMDGCHPVITTLFSRVITRTMDDDTAFLTSRGLIVTGRGMIIAGRALIVLIDNNWSLGRKIKVSY